MDNLIQDPFNINKPSMAYSPFYQPSGDQSRPNHLSELKMNDYKSKRPQSGKIKMRKDQEKLQYKYINEIDRYLDQKENYVKAMMGNKSSGTGGSKTIQGRYSGGNKSKGTSKNKKVNINGKISIGQHEGSSFKSNSPDNLQGHLADIKQRISYLENYLKGYLHQLDPNAQSLNQNPFLRMMSEFQVLIKNIQLKLTEKDYQLIGLMEERDSWQERYFQMTYHNDKLHQLNDQLRNELQRLRTIALKENNQKGETIKPIQHKDEIEVVSMRNDRSSEIQVLNGRVEQKASSIKRLQTKIISLNGQLEKAQFSRDKYSKQCQEKDKLLQQIKSSLNEVQKHSQTKIRNLQKDKESFFKLLMDSLQISQKEQMEKIKQSDYMNNDLKDKVVEAKKQKKSLESKLDKLSQKLKDVEKQLKDSKNKEIQIQKQCKIKEVEIKVQLSEAQEKCLTIKADAKRFQRDLKTVKERNEKLIGNIQNMYDNIQIIEEQLEQKNQLLAKSNNLVEDLRNQLIRSRNQNEQLEENNKQKRLAVSLFSFALMAMKSDLTEKINELQKQADQWENQQRSEKKHIKTLTKRIQEKKEIIEERENTIKNKQKMIEEKQKAINKYLNIQREFKAKLKKNELKIQELEDSIQQSNYNQSKEELKMNRNIQKLMDQLNNGKQQYQELENKSHQKMKEHLQQLNNKDNQILAIKERVSGLQIEIQGYTSQIRDKQSNIKFQQKQIRDKTLQIESLKEIIKIKDDQLSQNQYQIHQQTQREVELRQRQQLISEKLTNYEKLQQQLTLTRDKHDILVSEIQKSKKRMEMVSKREEDVKIKELSIEKIDETIHNLETQISKNQITLEQNENAIKNFLAQINDLSDKCNQLKEKDNQNKKTISQLNIKIQHFDLKQKLAHNMVTTEALQTDNYIMTLKGENDVLSERVNQLQLEAVSQKEKYGQLEKICETYIIRNGNRIQKLVTNASVTIRGEGQIQDYGLGLKQKLINIFYGLVNLKTMLMNTSGNSQSYPQVNIACRNAVSPTSRVNSYEQEHEQTINNENNDQIASEIIRILENLYCGFAQPNTFIKTKGMKMKVLKL